MQRPLPERSDIVWTLLVASLMSCALQGCETQFTMAPAAPGTSGGAVNPAAGSVTAGGAINPTAGSVTTGGAFAGGGTGAVTASTTGGATAPQAGEMAGGTDTLTGGAVVTGGSTTDGTGGMMMDDTNVPQTCPASSALQPGETTETIQVGSATRTYILHVPASYDGQTPVPLVLDFHGILMSSTLERNFSGFASLSDQEGFIVAFPEGTDTAFNVGICCTSSTAVDDIGFARAIVEHLSEQGCIDQKRIHAVGYSMGGGMSMYLACNAADMFASIAYSAFDLMPEEDEPCHPSRPIAELAFRSTGDPVVAYAGAVDTVPPNGNPNLVTFIGAQANLEKWASLDGCTGSPEDAGGGCQYYRQCSEGVEAGLCTKQGGGHDYMDAAAGWAFLKKHPMP